MSNFRCIFFCWLIWCPAFQSKESNDGNNPFGQIEQEAHIDMPRSNDADTARANKRKTRQASSGMKYLSPRSFARLETCTRQQLSPKWISQKFPSSIYLALKNRTSFDRTSRYSSVQSCDRVQSWVDALDQRGFVVFLLRLHCDKCKFPFLAKSKHSDYTKFISISRGIEQHIDQLFQLAWSIRWFWPKEEKVKLKFMDGNRSLTLRNKVEVWSWSCLNITYFAWEEIALL